jgi:hypothetical protein
MDSDSGLCVTGLSAAYALVPTIAVAVDGRL